jgi:hypothetical protein
MVCQFDIILSSVKYFSRLACHIAGRFCAIPVKVVDKYARYSYSASNINNQDKKFIHDRHTGRKQK